MACILCRSRPTGHGANRRGHSAVMAAAAAAAALVGRTAVGPRGPGGGGRITSRSMYRYT